MNKKDKLSQSISEAVSRVQAVLKCFGSTRQPVWDEARASGCGAPLLQQLLPDVLPDQQRPAHVDVEGADDALLRDLHAHVQLLDQIRWNPFTFIAGEEKWKKKG